MVMGRRRRFPITRYASVEAMKADEYDYWRQRPDHERIRAVSEITSEAYGLKRDNVGELRKTLVRVKRQEVRL